MRVKSALANLEVGIGEVSRRGSDLILRSAPGSAVDTEIAVSAREALSILRRILTTGGGLWFVLTLPFFALRPSNSAAASQASLPSSTNINKPW